MVITSKATITSYVDVVMAKLTQKVATVLNDAASELQGNVVDEISHGDHTLKQLKQADHPYAKRHGTISRGYHGPFGVHAREERLLGALNYAPPALENGWLVAHAYLEETLYDGGKYDFDLVAAVHQGEGKMIPRPFLTGQITNEARWKIYKAILFAGLRG